MKKFASGLIIGVIIGAFGTFGILMHMASRAPKSLDLSLPSSPIKTAEGLSSFLAEHPYEIGFFAKDLKTGKIAERHADRSVCLASIVKVFCLTELYRQKHAESLDLNQTIDVPKQGEISLMKAADLMIGQSNNEATQSLAKFLGRDNVNRIPSLLGLESLDANILPDEGIFKETLDKRIFGERLAVVNLPQHGTARDMAKYFELLLNREVISEPTSEELIEFFMKHPKPFSTRHAGKYNFAGKGGNLLWIKSPKHYSMMGWSLFLTKQTGEHIVLCVWGEWFPKNMPPDQQSEFLKFVTDSIIEIVES
jgi:hypothetical protein